MGRPPPNYAKPDSLKSNHGEKDEADMLDAQSEKDATDVQSDMQLATKVQSDAHYEVHPQSPSYPPPTRPPPYPPLSPNGNQEPPLASATPLHFPPSRPKPSGVKPAVVDGDNSLRTVRNKRYGHSWSTGLFDCGQHQTNAIMTAFFPCVTFGQIAEILDEGETNCTLDSFIYIMMASALCNCWILGSRYRQKLRKKYNLVQAPAKDWTLHLLCPFCSLCQEFRELQIRGIDPSHGWMGYLAKQQETITEPPKSQTMR